MDLLLISALGGALVWFWYDSLRSRERAMLAAAVACRDIGAQLLDQTVALQKLTLARNADGHINLKRIYGFEFSLAGYERMGGRAYLLGQRLEQVQLDRAEGTVIEVKA